MRSPAGGDHLLVLGLFHAFEREVLDVALFIGLLVIGGVPAAVGRGIAGIAAQRAGGFVAVVGDGVGQRAAREFTAGLLAIAIGHGLGAAPVDEGDLRGAGVEVGLGNFAGAVAADEDFSGVWIGIHG